MHAFPRSIVLGVLVLLIPGSSLGCSEEPAAQSPPALAARPAAAEPVAAKPAATVPDAPPPTVSMAPEQPEDVPTIGQSDPPRPRLNDGEVLPIQQAGSGGSDMILGIADGRYAQLLRSIVDDNGLVRYDRLQTRTWTAAIREVVTAYGKAPWPEDRNRRLALLCNAYNANVLAMILEEKARGAVGKIDAIKGFFDARAITVAGRSMTLNGLENDHIRTLGDARTHAALVCAAMSCPPLGNEPYDADRLDEQLDGQCRAWVNDPAKNRFADGALQVSRIFEWYAEDFQAAPYGSVAGFVRRFADPDGAFGPILATAEVPKVTYLEYDWALNQAPIRDDPEK